MSHHCPAHLPLESSPFISDPCLGCVPRSFSQLKSAGKCKGVTHLPPRPEPVGQCSRVSKSGFHLCQHQELPSAFVGLLSPTLFSRQLQVESGLSYLWGIRSSTSVSQSLAELRDCLRSQGETHTAVVLSSRTLLFCTSGLKVPARLEEEVTGHP